MMMLNPRLELCDLHIHVGGAVAPHILWSIAHDQGFKLPVSTYWEFRDLVTAAPDRVAFTRPRRPEPPKATPSRSRGIAGRSVRYRSPSERSIS